MNAMPAAAGKRAEAGVCARARGSPLSPTSVGHTPHDGHFSLLTAADQGHILYRICPWGQINLLTQCHNLMNL